MKQDLAVLRQDRRAIGAVAPLVGGGEDGIGASVAAQAPRRQRREESRARGLQEIAAVDQRRAHRQSPSSEEKPAVSPSAPDSRVPNSSDRLEVTSPK